MLRFKVNHSTSTALSSLRRSVGYPFAKRDLCFSFAPNNESVNHTTDSTLLITLTPNSRNQITFNNCLTLRR